MSDFSWASNGGPAWEEAKRVVIANAPAALGGVGIVLGGWIAALVARRVVERLLRAARFNDIVGKSRVGDVVKALGKKWTPAKLVAHIAYLTILLLTLNTLSSHFRLDGLQEAVSGVLAYLPKAAGGITILAVGVYLASVAKRSVGAVLRELRNPAAGLLETATEVGIVLVASLVTLDVLGVDLGFVTSNLTLLLAATLIVVVFLACWSMRHPAEELAANYYVRRMLSVGDFVQTKQYQGTVQEFQPLGVILRDAKGDEHFVPAKHLVSGMQRRQGLSPD